MLDILFLNKGIHPWHVEGRVKEYNSFQRKMSGKDIDNPEEIFDLVGLRVICFILSDVRKVNEVIEKNFGVVEKRENTKEVGYRSVHYIVLVSEDRLKLPEYEKFKGLKFEIQIRTILEHAWAEIEHDRNYKSESELPADLQQGFSQLSKDLQSADERFQKLVDNTEKYRDSVSQQTKKEKLDTDVNSVSIEGYFRGRFGSEHEKREELVDKDIVDELKSRGIESLRDLASMITNETEKYRKLSQITGSSFSRIAVADIYNSRDKAMLRPKFLRAVFDISDRDNSVCVNEVECLKETGLGGYLEGIIPYLVADLEQDGLVEYCEKGEIRLTQKGRDEVKKTTSGS